MILSGKRIKKAVQDGEIEISDFSLKRLNPNSYDLRLNSILKIYDSGLLNIRKDNPTSELVIPSEGLVLMPGELYLGSTIERTKSDVYAPIIFGKSSIGRLGLFVHISAGFGDVGFDGHWTLGLTCIKPILILPKMKIAQVCFFDVLGEKTLYGEDLPAKYQHNNGVQSSQSFRDFE